MSEIKNRSEISNEYKWDLTAIYKSLEDLKKDEKKVQKLIDELPKYEDVMLNSAKDLYDTTTKMFEAARIVEKIYTYAHLKYNEDITLSSSIELLEKATNINIKFNQKISYYDSKLLSVEYSTIENFYKDCEKLKLYIVNLK